MCSQASRGPPAACMDGSGMVEPGAALAVCMHATSDLMREWRKCQILCRGRWAKANQI